MISPNSLLTCGVTPDLADFDELTPEFEEFLLHHFDLYDELELCHGKLHIKECMDNAFHLMEDLSIFSKPLNERTEFIEDTLTAIVFHDISLVYGSAQRSVHEILSANFLLNSSMARKFLNIERRIKISEAIRKHRKSKTRSEEISEMSLMEKIVHDADFSYGIENIVRRCLAYHVEDYYSSHIIFVEDPIKEYIIPNSKKHLIEKFGKNGYAGRLLNVPSALKYAHEQTENSFKSLEKIDKILEEQLPFVMECRFNRFK
jgi:hypothetical protein